MPKLGDSLIEINFLVDFQVTLSLKIFNKALIITLSCPIILKEARCLFPLDCLFVCLFNVYAAHLINRATLDPRKRRERVSILNQSPK